MPQSKIRWYEQNESPSLRLSAAAPEMLAALRRLDIWAKHDKTGAAREIQGIITEARQAIAKAEGVAP